MIAAAAASLPWLLYEGRREVESHPLLDLLARPNPAQTGADLVEALVSNLLLFGNAYIEASRVEGEPRELHALRPDRMSVVTGRNGWPAAYDYTVAGQTVRFPMGGAGLAPILHMKLFNPLDDHYGLPPLAAAQVALDTHNAAGFWNKALLDNAARPSGALVYQGADGHLTDAQFERLRGELEENFSGAANAGRPLLLEGGLDWKAMSLSPKDMDFIEAKAAAAREIALAFGVPPLLLGLPGDNTRANYAEANLAFSRQTVIPTLARLQKSVAAWLAPAYRGALRFDYDVDRIDALSADRAVEWKRVGEASFLTIDEKRAALGYGPKPQGAAPAEAAKDMPALERRYSADPARSPAGSPEGGRWTGDGGSGGSAGEGGEGGSLLDAIGNLPKLIADTVSEALAPFAAGEDGDWLAQVPEGNRYSIDLLEEEARGGHAMEKHVGKSDEYLLNRVRTERVSGFIFTEGLQAASSFSSLPAANKLVNATLSSNSDVVDAVVSGERGNKLAAIIRLFGTPTGKQAFANSGRSQPYMREAYGMKAIIRRDSSSPNGFLIFDAYPFNTDE